MNSSYKRATPMTEENSKGNRSILSGISEPLRGTTLDLVLDETMIKTTCQVSPEAAILLVFHQVSKLKGVLADLCTQNETLKAKVAGMEKNSGDKFTKLRNGARTQRRAMHNAYQDLNRRVLELTADSSNSQDSDFFRGFKELRNYAGRVVVDDAIDEEMYSDMTNSDSRISGQTELENRTRKRIPNFEEEESSDNSFVRSVKLKTSKPEEESKRVQVSYTNTKKRDYPRPATAEPKKTTKEAVKLDPETAKEIEGDSQKAQVALDTMVEVYGDSLGRQNDPKFVEDMRVTTSEVKKIMDNRKITGRDNSSPKNGMRSPVGGGGIFLPDINRSPSIRGLRKLTQEGSKSMLDSPLETEIVTSKPDKQDQEARNQEISEATKYYLTKFLNEDKEEALKRREEARKKKEAALEKKKQGKASDKKPV